MIDFSRLRAAYEKVRDELLAERTADGHWVGELSSSALSTATAVSALAVVRNRGFAKLDMESAVLSTEYSVLSTRYSAGPGEIDQLIHLGIDWLTRQQNEDGGFGDTDLSHSNIATTMLVVAAIHLAGVADNHAELLKRADGYIEANGRLQGLRERYGIDKTFVVPIMTNLALAGLVDWREVDPLPFELACVPQSWYRFVGMPVVSYAIPALVAIGQARYFHGPPPNPFTRLIRRLSTARSLQVLRRMQPESGGYLEATPLTSFVVMSLASIHSSPHAPREESITRSVMPTRDEVIREGVKFLINSVRPDGSWPIDTNLATWNTTLAINALAGAGEDVATLLGNECLEWLLSCQHKKRHAFTGADPGGFGWSNLSGAVPDGDDTPGALLAIRSMKPVCEPSLANLDNDIHQVGIGVSWLLRLQNRDGGWPTFCRGWGRLPFDRSGTDLTAHVLRSFAAWKDWIACPQIDRIDGQGGMPRLLAGHRAAMQYLCAKQNADGSWSPLWFGNQDHPTEDNPVYGTAKVLMAYRDLGLIESPEAQHGVAWLVANQNADGGWGSGVWSNARNVDSKRRVNIGVESLGEPVLSTKYSVPSTQPEPDSTNARIPNPQSAIRNLQSSLEETSLAVEALLAALPPTDLRSPISDLPTPDPRPPTPVTAAVTRGLAWLIDRMEHDEHRQPAPIGFYFAKLWYYEKLYPLIFATAALGRAWAVHNNSALQNKSTLNCTSRQLAPRPDEILQPETASSRSS
jgi:squalene-hopene/tetraprenyl-beta-curcumene cyclase